LIPVQTHQHNTTTNTLHLTSNRLLAAGAVPSPFDCFLVLRGIKTLHLRMERHQENAMAAAKFLSSHEKVEKVLYPGLPSHPQHDLAKRQMRGFGGMVTVWLKGDIKEGRVFMENLKIFALAESLGGVESLANHPEQMTHASVPAERRKILGITGNMIRLSVGVETTSDIVADLEQALAKL
jgi:cystathionine gamma-lyase